MRAPPAGRVVDAAIVDIVAMLGTLVHWIRANGQIDGAQPSPFHDSPFYDVYACADGGFISLGAIEPPFTPCCCRSWAWRTWSLPTSTTRQRGRR